MAGPGLGRGPRPPRAHHAPATWRARARTRVPRSGRVPRAAPFFETFDPKGNTMHELGVVFHMVDILEDVAREQDLTVISKVVVDLGEVSGVITEFFDDAWTWACNRSDLLRGAELEICQIDAVTVCNACGKTYGTVAHGRICPHCGSADTELLRGNELEIREIEAY